MVKMKRRKKPFPGSSTVLQTESQASNDAPDNPGTIFEVERLSSIRDHPRVFKRSLRLHFMEARIVRNNFEQNTNELVLTGNTGNNAYEDNDVKQHHIDSTKSADAQSRTSILVLLSVHNQEWLSLANKSA